MPFAHPCPLEEPDTNVFQSILTICNRRGLHARASAKFVKCVQSFDATIQVTKDNQTVGGTSIMGLMMLTAAPGSNIHVIAEGPDAKAALSAISLLVNNKFGEDE